MQLNILRTIVGHRFQFRDGTDRMPVPAGAFPDIQGRSPVPVSADPPVLHVFQPVAEASLSDGLRNPVDLIVIFNQLLPHVRHFNKPRIARIVDQRGIAAPAVRIGMLERDHLVEQSPRIQILYDFLVGILAEQPGPRRFRRHFSFVVHQL